MLNSSLKFEQIIRTQYFIKVQKLNRGQEYQTLYLSRFDFTLKQMLGTKMEKANKLSRRLNWKVGVEKNNNNQTLIKEQWIYSLTEAVIEESKIDIIEKIKIAKGKNKEIVRVVEEKRYICQRMRSQEQK